ncbi:helix-turn-helix domain-containing protein, partial [Sphingomonas trueperi]
MPFEIRQLCYAIAAADHGSFYRAARALDIEQSTLSRSISKLERSIGMSIFERSRAGVKTTLAGAAFIRGARPMVGLPWKNWSNSEESPAGRENWRLVWDVSGLRR